MSAHAPIDLEALSDLCTPWCLRVAATLRLPEHLAAGTEEVTELAAVAGCDEYALARVLTHLAGKGVFEEVGPRRFRLSDAARLLLDPGMRLGLDLEGIGGRMAYAWGTLLDYVRTGRPGYEKQFGLPFWADLELHPQVGASFDALIGPAGHGMPDPDFSLTNGWDEIRTVVDVGGGTGAMLAALLRQRPQLRGTLVDLPRVVSQSKSVFEEAGVLDRATTIGQSFFAPLPSGADLYILRGILNDWPDQEAQAILHRCAEASRPDGRVVILKGVVEDAVSHGLVIEMILAGGKQRTVAQIRDLIERAGMKMVAAQQQPAYFVVEARPISTREPAS